MKTRNLIFKKFVSGQGTTNLQVRPPTYGSSGTVGVNVANGCNTGESPGTIYTTVRTGGGGGGGGCLYEVSIFPNPAAKELSIVSESGSNESAPDGLLYPYPCKLKFTVNLVNNNGKLQKSGTSTDGKLVLNISDLPRGVYHLQLGTDEGVTTYQILIER
jgi:hypothetical protein